MGKGSFIPHFAGAFVGLMFFSLASVWLGEPVIPSMEGVMAKVEYPDPEPLPVLEGPETGEQVYNRVCGACHQATGLGLPPTFPPLAESPWVNQDAETPIRIVLAGLAGPIDVKGTTYNQMMPSQAALSDAEIARVLTYVRSSFGNSAGEVKPEQVAAIRAEGRGSSWSAEELSGLRGGGSAAATPSEGAVEAAAAGTATQEVVEEVVEEVPAEPAVEVDPAVLAEAKKNFESICASCHGASGGGDGAAAIALNPKPAAFNDPNFWASRDRDHLITVISKGGPAVGKSALMAAFGAQFSAEQIEGLADYVMTFKP